MTDDHRRILDLARTAFAAEGRVPLPDRRDTRAMERFDAAIERHGAAIDALFAELRRQLAAIEGPTP